MKKTLKTLLSCTLCLIVVMSTMVCFSPDTFAYSWLDYYNYLYGSGYYSTNSEKTHDVYYYEVSDKKITITDCKSSASGNL